MKKLHIGSTDSDFSKLASQHQSSSEVEYNLNDPKSLLLKVIVVCIYGAITFMLFWEFDIENKE